MKTFCFVFIFIPIDATQHHTLPYRQLGTESIEYRRKRFPWSSLSPTGTRIRKSFKQKYLHADWPIDPVDAAIESLPFELRVIALLNLLTAGRRSDLAGLIKAGIPYAKRFDEAVDIAYRNYMNHIIGNSHLEVSLMKRFLAHMYDGKQVHESAQVVANELRDYAKSRWNVSVDFITPSMLLDWSHGMQIASGFRIECAEEQSNRFQQGLEISSQELLNLEIATFKEMIKFRRQKLVLTGYEYIDL